MNDDQTMQTECSRSLWGLELCTRVPVTLSATACAIMHRAREGDVRSVRRRDADLLAGLEVVATVDDGSASAICGKIS